MSDSKKSYRQICEEFRWEDVFGRCDWNPAEGFNIAHEVCDRYAGELDRVAVFWLGKDGKKEEITFAKLKELSDRFANVLTGLGVKKGDRVAGLLPKVPELLVTVLGTLKLGAVYVPLFTAFGPMAVQFRLNHSQAKVVVTNSEYVGNIKEVIGDLPKLKHIININSSREEGTASGRYSSSTW